MPRRSERGDEAAAGEAAALIERLPLTLERTQLSAASLAERAATNRHTLLSAALYANHVIVGSAAHAAAVRGWHALLAALWQHGHVARPLVPLKQSAAAEARAPSWLSGGEGLEGQLATRASKLASEQWQWVEVCEAAVQLRAHAEAAGAACELLRQQASRGNDTPRAAHHTLRTTHVTPHTQHHIPHHTTTAPQPQHTARTKIMHRYTDALVGGPCVDCGVKTCLLRLLDGETFCFLVCNGQPAILSSCVQVGVLVAVIILP